MCCAFAEVVIAPPAVYLPLVKDTLRKDFFVSAQNSWVGKGGAFTGETRYANTTPHNSHNRAGMTEQS